MITVQDVLDHGYTIDIDTGSLFTPDNKKLSDRLGANTIVINARKEYIARNLLVYYYSKGDFLADLDRSLAKTILFVDGNRENLVATNLIHVDKYLSDNSFIEHPDIKGLYANTCGTVFSYDSCITLGSINSYGYRVVKFRGKAYQAHRIVYECITQTSIPLDWTVHHIDANKLNNNFRNLDIMSRADNTRESNIRNREDRIGENHHGSKLTAEMVVDIYLTSDPASILAKKYNVSVTSVLNIRKNKVWVDLTKDLAQPRYTKLLGKTKLTEEQVIRIYREVLTIEDRKRIASEYNVSSTTIDDIIKKRTWRSVTDILDIKTL